MWQVKGLIGVRDERPLFSKLNFSVHPGEIHSGGRVKNGAVKASLLRILAGLAGRRC